MITCKNCGKIFDDGAQFCTSCGCMLDNEFVGETNETAAANVNYVGQEFTQTVGIFKENNGQQVSQPAARHNASVSAPETGAQNNMNFSQTPQPEKKKKGFTTGKKIAVAVVAVVVVAAIVAGGFLSGLFTKKVKATDIKVSSETITVKAGETAYLAYDVIAKSKNGGLIVHDVNDGYDESKTSTFVTLPVEYYDTTDDTTMTVEEFESFYTTFAKGKSVEYGISGDMMYNFGKSETTYDDIIKKHGVQLDGTKLDEVYNNFIAPIREKESNETNPEESNFDFMVSVTGITPGTGTLEIKSGKITKTITVNVVE